MMPFISLSDREKKFIVTAAMNADLSVKELSDRLEMREHVCRNIRQSLLARGIIQPLHLIDIYRLGFTDFRVFLSDISEPSRIRSVFEKRILNYPQVYWLAKMNGAFQYAITFLAKETREIIDFFAAIQTPNDGFYARRTLAIAGDWTVFSPTYLTPGARRPASISFTTRERNDHLDKTDHAILSCMARNPSATIASLARLGGMKKSSLAYRVAKLTEQGVIRGQIYLLNCAALGVLVYRVMIVERGLSTEQRTQLLKYLSSHPNVVALLTCAGGWDYEVRFETETVDRLEDFCVSIIDTFGSRIGTILTSQQASILKRVSYPCN
jgi:DNA-binding Lrp family transcriptional regulator